MKIKAIKVKEVMELAKYWATESEVEIYSEKIRKMYRERTLTIVTMLTNIELDRMKIDVNNFDRFNEKFDEIYDKYYKEIFG